MRRRKNRIGAIEKEGGGWAVSEREIRMEFVNFFKGIYSQTIPTDHPVQIPREVSDSITTIPTEGVHGLDMIPSEEEIRWAVFALGPTKSPGPDGVNAALIQENWDAFKQVVNAEVLAFFRTGRMKENIAHSSLVLIPKVPTPTTVTQFIPISVCNFLYKVISKLLAKKMQPFMNSIISHAQTAFIPGREISENIILLREIIHSFEKKNSNSYSFAFKADLAKAFDSVRWEFLFYLLPLYGFPQKFCKWIEACVKSAKFTIQLNGQGDGFFKPTRGLRQGCSLSPYLFILTMDPLARWLNLKMERGIIRGVKLARTAPPMACSMFADDLILMGALTELEVRELKVTLTSFFSISGLNINNAKSKVWFSVNAEEDHKRIFRSHFQVPDATEGELYLGCPVKVSGRASFDYLVEKFERRLNSWKAKMLSHTGRLILIKSVLESLPIYTMGTAIVPTRVLKKLTAIMRNFFWGGNLEKNHMAYVAWAKITAPKGMGGLGL